jgi:hypothetical protein
VPEAAVDKVVVPSVSDTLVVPVADQVRSKLLPAPGAAVRVHVGPAGRGVTGGKVFETVHVPPDPAAVSV